jgi:hypothetical protein
MVFEMHAAADPESWFSSYNVSMRVTLFEVIFFFSS